jgi:hypothetical protein
VACPMFSALWAIANQEAGAPLGQVAQYVYSLPAGAVTDIVPVSSTGKGLDQGDDRNQSLHSGGSIGRNNSGDAREVHQRDLGLSF